ncbi:MAG: response regulator transcription factor [Steroidobacteraceae bacterium]|jgi:DNA-binding NarL/FixJ family response regulator
MAKVLIADDHPMTRAGLRHFLEDERSVTQIGEAGTGEETLDQLRSGSWDLVILDINMPDRGGLDILRHVRASYPQVKVLVVSAFPERQYAINAIKAGAGGYLPKESASEELLRAVRVVALGRRYVTPNMAELMASELDSNNNEPLHRRLSEREFQIFCKLAAGHTVSAIANELCLSVKTVSTYRTRVLEKMSLLTNADITTYALRNELIH